jgi:MHS family shikimate/dehydroshikimate transporter-like MFS transporter
VRDPDKPQSDAALIFLATAIGSTFEQYDFLIYGMSSALFFNRLFFPAFSPAAGALAAIGIYSVGYCARPLGGIICGHFGDRIGRKSMLLITFLVMGAATVLIGCLPVYKDIGIAAPLGLIALRFIQGLAIGGEHSGSGVFAVESAPPDRRGLYGTWPAMGIFGGALLATSALGLAGVVSGDDFMAWGWRLPFIASVVLLGLGTMLRLKLPESPAFRAVVETHTVQAIPLFVVLREFPGTTAIVIVCRVAEIGWGMMLAIIGATYITGKLGLPRSYYLHAVEVSAVLSIGALYISGRLIDRYGRRTVFIAGAVMAGVLAFPFFTLLDTHDAGLIILAMVLGDTLAHAPMIGTQQSFFSELFPSQVRFTGVAFGQQFGAALGGGLLPPVFAGLLSWSGGDPTPVAMFMVALAALAVLAAALAPETLGRSLQSELPSAVPLLNPVRAPYPE